MNITYSIFEGTINDSILNGITELHQAVFETKDDLAGQLANKPKLLVIAAMAKDEVIGYKIGYELDHEKFYSWLGGVSSNHRKDGVASKLMDVQHRYLKDHGYKTVQTKTMNKWRGMLILNIKSGFEITDTYLDEKGLFKIVLEKSLVE